MADPRYVQPPFRGREIIGGTLGRYQKPTSYQEAIRPGMDAWATPPGLLYRDTAPTRQAELDALELQALAGPPDVVASTTRPPQNPAPTAAARPIPDPRVLADQQANRQTAHSGPSTIVADSANQAIPVVTKQAEPTTGAPDRRSADPYEAKLASKSSIAPSIEQTFSAKGGSITARGLDRNGRIAGYGQVPASMRSSGGGGSNEGASRVSPADAPGEKTYRGSHWDNYASTSGSQREIDHGVQQGIDDRYDQELQRIHGRAALADPRRQQLEDAKIDAELARARAQARDPMGVQAERDKYQIREGAMQANLTKADQIFEEDLAQATADLKSGTMTPEGFDALVLDLKEKRNMAYERYHSKGNWDVSNSTPGWR